MLFVKSKNKRKNVITALVITLLFSGSVFLDMATSPKSNDCACTDDPQVVNSDALVKQAGWFWGRGCSRRGRNVYRIFGIGIPTGGNCATCFTYGSSQATQREERSESASFDGLME